MSYYVTNENSVLNINNAHLKVSGNVMADVMKLGAIEFAPPGSDVGGTVNFTNVTTGVTTSSNLSVGGTLSLGTVEVVATTHTLANTTANGNVTPHTVQFSNATTGIVTTANVEVGGELTVTGNVAVDTDTLFVDTINSRVGIGTDNPFSQLELYGAGKDLTFKYDTGISRQSAATRDTYYSGLENSIKRVGDRNLFDGSLFTPDTTHEILMGFSDTYTQWSGNDEYYPSYNEMRFKLWSPSSSTVGSLTDVMTIRSDGNVGIGTADPGALLDLKKDSTNGATMNFESSGGYKTSISQKSSGTGDRALQFTSYGSSAGDNPVYNFLALNAAANAYNKILTMTGNGNVGIGDESPSYKLDIPTGNQCFINGVRFFNWGSNTANQTIDSGIPMKGYGGGGSVLVFFSFHNSSGDNTRTDVYILRKSYDATWVSDGTSVHTICSLKGSNSQTGTLTFGFNGSHLTTTYNQGGAQNYYALSFDNF